MGPRLVKVRVWSGRMYEKDDGSVGEGPRVETYRVKESRKNCSGMAAFRGLIEEISPLRGGGARCKDGGKGRNKV